MTVESVSSHLAEPPQVIRHPTGVCEVEGSDTVRPVATGSHRPDRAAMGSHRPDRAVTGTGELAVDGVRGELVAYAQVG